MPLNEIARALPGHWHCPDAVVVIPSGHRQLNLSFGAPTQLYEQLCRPVHALPMYCIGFDMAFMSIIGLSGLIDEIFRVAAKAKRKKKLKKNYAQNLASTIRFVISNHLYPLHTTSLATYNSNKLSADAPQWTKRI